MQKKKNTLIKVKEHLDFLLIALVVIPLILFALHFFLPEELKEKLALHRDYIIGYEIFTNHFIHLDLEHLLGNVISYLIAVILLYVSLTSINEKRMFYILFILNLTILPIIISLIWIPINKYIIIKFGSTRGFSGIVSSFVGMSICSIILSSFRKFGIKSKVAYFYLSILFLSIFLLTLLLIYFSNDFTLLLLTLSISMITIILLISYFKSIDKEIGNKFIKVGEIRLKVKYGFLILYLSVFILLISFTFLAFPFNPKNTNIIVHYIGFIIGMFVFFVVSNFLYVKSV